MAEDQESNDDSAVSDPFVRLLRRVAREAGGVEDLAGKSGVGKRTLTDWLNGRYPRARSSRALTRLDDWALEHISPYPGSGAPGTLRELAGPVGALADTPTSRRRRFDGRAESPATRSGPPDPVDSQLVAAPIGPNRRAVPLKARALAVGAVLGACLLGTTGWLNLTWLRTGAPVAISGSVRCESGANVMGVYVKMDDGIGSGFAQLSPPGDSPTRFTLTAPEDTYIVSVGCGSNGKDWKVSAYTARTSQFTADWVCDDVSPAATTWPFHGTCIGLAG